MKIKVCMWKTCMDRFSWYIIDRLENDKKRFNLKKLNFEKCLCLGQCKKWPNIVVKDDVHNYMNPAKASEFAFNTNKKKKKNGTI